MGDAVLAALEENEPSGHPLPVQVHTPGDPGLLPLTARSGLRKPGIERFRDTTFVLLHCYPCARGAGWLAHASVCLDLSLAIPFVGGHRARGRPGLQAPRSEAVRVVRGHGPDGTGQFFESIGLRPGRRNAIAAGATEAGGGILVALGAAMPVAAAGLSAVMITALRTVVWNEGIKPATGEHEVLLAVAALALTETGPGAPTLDSALGAEHSGAGWTLAALGAGAAGAALAISTGQRQPEPPFPLAEASHASAAETSAG